VQRAVQLIPMKSHVFGAGFETLLARGILGAAGLALIVPLFVPSRWRGRHGAELADDEYGPAMTEDGELVGVVPGSGDMPMGEAAVGPEDAAATARPAAGAVGAPARADASAATVHHGGLPHRTPPPGLVY
jgi:hypothetical protein